MCKAAVILQFKTAATWKEINRIQAPEITFLREVEDCAKYDWILNKVIGNVWKLYSSGKEYRITDANGLRASNAYAYGLEAITLKYRPCIEEHVGRRWQALIEQWKWNRQCRQLYKLKTKKRRMIFKFSNYGSDTLSQGVSVHSFIYFYSGAGAQIGPRPSHCWGF